MQNTKALLAENSRKWCRWVVQKAIKLLLLPQGRISYILITWLLNYFSIIEYRSVRPAWTGTWHCIKRLCWLRKPVLRVGGDSGKAEEEGKTRQLQISLRNWCVCVKFNL